MCKIYLAVTSDKYELPLDFDIYASALAKRFNIPVVRLFNEISQRKTGRLKEGTKGHKGYRFYAVEVDDE